MIKTNYLFFWQVVKETFSKTQGYIGMFFFFYVFINYIYPLSIIYIRKLVASVVAPNSFEVGDPFAMPRELIIITNELFYLTSFVTSFIKILFIIGLIKVTVNYLNNHKLSLKNYLFSFYNFVSTLFFVVYFGWFFSAVNYLIAMLFMGIMSFSPPEIPSFTLISGFIEIPHNIFMLLFTLPIFVFVTHPQFTILKIIKRSYQLFCQKPLAILGLYFITTLIWWVYSFHIRYFIGKFIVDFSRNFYRDPLYLYSALYYLYDPIIKGGVMLFTLLSILIAYSKIAKAKLIPH